MRAYDGVPHPPTHAVSCPAPQCGVRRVTRSLRNSNPHFQCTPKALAPFLATPVAPYCRFRVQYAGKHADAATRCLRSQQGAGRQQGGRVRACRPWRGPSRAQVCWEQRSACVQAAGALRAASCLSHTNARASARGRRRRWQQSSNAAQRTPLISPAIAHAVEVQHWALVKLLPGLPAGPRLPSAGSRGSLGVLLCVS